jgi:hypothetical protein
MLCVAPVAAMGNHSCLHTPAFIKPVQQLKFLLIGHFEPVSDLIDCTQAADTVSRLRIHLAYVLARRCNFVTHLFCQHCFCQNATFQIRLNDNDPVNETIAGNSVARSSSLAAFHAERPTGA